MDCLFAAGAGRHRTKLMSASFVDQAHGGAVTGPQPGVRPPLNGDDHAIKVDTLRREPIAALTGSILIARQNSRLDKTLQAVRQYIGGDAGAQAKVIKPANSEEGADQDFDPPLVPENIKAHAEH